MRILAIAVAAAAMFIAFSLAPQWAKDAASCFKIMGALFAVYMAGIWLGVTA